MGLLGSIAGSVIGGLFGNHQANKQLEYQDKWNREQMAMQVEENQKNRDFNASQAEISRNFQKEMFDETNTYNSMQNQVSQMKAAGLNPALAYSGGAGFSPAFSPSGATASSSNGYSPIPAASADYTASTLAGMRALSEIRNIDAQTRKLDNEGSILESDAKFRDAWNSKELTLKDVQISLGESQIDLNDNQSRLALKTVEKLQNEVNAWHLTVDSLNETIVSQKLDNLSKAVDLFYKSPQYEAIIRNLESSTSVNSATAHRALTLLGHEISKMDSETNMNNVLSSYYKILGCGAYLQGSKTSTETDLMRVQLDGAKTYRNAINGLGDFGRGLDAARQFLSGILSISVSAK